VEDTGFKLWHTGTTTIKNGVGIIIDKSLMDGVVDLKRQVDKFILVKLLVVDFVLNVISAYTPQICLDDRIKRQFWRKLDVLVRSVLIFVKIFIGVRCIG
jgi:hypothetical protein